MNLPEETPPPEEIPPVNEPPSEVLVQPARSESSETIPSLEQSGVPEGFQPLPAQGNLTPARKRRARRMLVLPGNEERSALLSKLSSRAFPSFEFFIFSLFSGAILGAAYILDAQSFLLLGILLAPLMTPWVGVVLASAVGSWRFFFQATIGLLVGAVLIFGTGAIAGVAARIWLPLPTVQAGIYSQLWWPNLFVVALGAILLTLSFVRSEEKPILPSVMLAYELYLPLSAGGFGLGAGLLRIWPDGLLVFLAHLALATLLGLITLVFLKFRPLGAKSSILGIITFLGTLAAIVVLSGIASSLFQAQPTLHPTSTPTLQATPSQEVPATPTSLPTTPVPPTLTPTPQLPPTATPTETATLIPTPVYARIYSKEGGGAIVRSEPGGGVVITSLINGIVVEILPERQTMGNVVWVHIYIPSMKLDGWVQQDVLDTTPQEP